MTEQPRIFLLLHKEGNKILTPQDKNKEITCMLLINCWLGDIASLGLPSSPSKSFMFVITILCIHKQLSLYPKLSWVFLAFNHGIMIWIWNGLDKNTARQSQYCINKTKQNKIKLFHQFTIKYFRIQNILQY